MRGILIILDGVADLPCKELNGKTPLDAASTPNLDFLAKNGKTGIMQTSKHEGPESGIILNILGYPEEISRGTLETIGTGIKLDHGDLCLRVNLATMKKGKMVDRRAGRTLTTKEAKLLAKTINKKLKLQFPFIFKPTVQHRAVLVFKGGFSDNITNADPEYSKSLLAEPLDDEETTKLSANLVNSFIEKVSRALKNHPVNKKREKANQLPANTIIVRDAGTGIPMSKQKKDWLAIVTMPTEIGVARLMGMKVVKTKWPKASSYDIYKNLYKRLNAQIKIAKKSLSKPNSIYIHFKETDVPGHDGLPLEKKKMIELLDREFFSAVRKLKNTFIVVTADHATPCKLKKHSGDPIPLLAYGKEKDKVEKFSEKDCKKGSLGIIQDKDLMKKLHLA